MTRWTKKSDRRTKYINPYRDNEIDEFIHSDLFRHGGVNFIDSLTIVSYFVCSC